MKNRLATALAAPSLTPAASLAADWPPAARQLYRPVAFIPRQAVEWTGLYFRANAGYGWARASTDTSFEGEFQGGTTSLLGTGATELGRSLGGSGIPQAEPATAAGRGTEHAPTAATNEPKVATSTIKNFADIEDAEGSATLAAVPGAIMLPALKQRQQLPFEAHHGHLLRLLSGR